MPDRLPLFLLKTVLFPGMTLPLHIFEERYKLMINRCVEQRAPFGVVLIRSGEEVGAPAEPYDVGTIASITKLKRLEDGRINLVASGERRFRIDRLDRSEPYLTGEVAILPSKDRHVPETEGESQKVAALYGEQFRLVLSVTGQWVRSLSLPGEPDALANFVAADIEAPPETKQELLETLSVPLRLRREAELLGEIIRKLTERWEERQRQRFAGGGLN